MTQSDRVWTVQAALDWTRSYLERKGDASPLLSARHLLSYATGLTQLELYTHFDQPLSREERAVLREGVRRRAEGEPLQYISGRAPFRYIEVTVRSGVLIPRPETEILVGEVLSFVEDVPQPFVLEIGCGSGCIACSIAVESPDSSVVATDVSPEAWAVARENVELLGVGERVDILSCDLDAAVPEDLEGRFDAFVSNPPYIPDLVMEALPAEVKGFEPRLALAGGEDGLDMFRRLLPAARRWLRSGGLFAVELHEECLDEAASLAEAAGFAEARIVEDLAGRPRVLCAVLG